MADISFHRVSPNIHNCPLFHWSRPQNTQYTRSSCWVVSHRFHTFLSFRVREAAEFRCSLTHGLVHQFQFFSYIIHWTIFFITFLIISTIIFFIVRFLANCFNFWKFLKFLILETLKTNESKINWRDSLALLSM